MLGVAFVYKKGSRQYHDRVDQAFTDETIYELYYAYHVSNWLVISPDIQYIDNTGGRGEVGETITAGVRMRVSF